MFSLEETTTWTAEDAIERLKHTLPQGWDLKISCEEGWYTVVVTDLEGRHRVEENADLKLAALGLLGWFSVKDRAASHPAWKVRDQEVELARPKVSDELEDPPDLDPTEVGVVYRSR